MTSQQDGTREMTDSELLERAATLSRVLVSQDDDLLREAALCQNQGRHFMGLIFAPAIRITLGEFVADLELLSLATTPEEWVGRVEYLPLK